MFDDMGIDQNIFYDEVMNKLTAVEIALDQAQNGTNDKEVINEIFRAFHTVKGVSDLLGFLNIVSLTHKAEDLLDEIRNENIQFTPDTYYLFFELKKFISQLVNDALNGIDMDEEKVLTYSSFKEEIDKHMSKEADIPILTNMPETILILEKNLNLINYINNMANETKYNIIAKENCEDIIETIKKIDISLLVCDIQTSRYTSMSLIKQLKDETKYRKIPVVIAIDKVKKDLKTVGEIVGAAGWIKKPYDKKVFCKIVNNVLQNQPLAV